MFILAKVERKLKKKQKKKYDSVTEKFHLLSVLDLLNDNEKYKEKQSFAVTKHYNTRSKYSKTVQKELKRQLLRKVPKFKMDMSKWKRLCEERAKLYLDQGEINKEKLHLNTQQIFNECQNSVLSASPHMLCVYVRHILWNIMVKIQAKEMNDEY